MWNISFEMSYGQVKDLRPDSGQMEEASNEKSCTKDVGEIFRLHNWSRGVQVIVGADLCVVVQISENNEQHVKGSFPLLPSSVGQGEEPLHGPAVSRGATTKFAISKNPNDTKHSK